MKFELGPVLLEEQKVFFNNNEKIQMFTYIRSYSKAEHPPASDNLEVEVEASTSSFLFLHLKNKIIYTHKPKKH